MFKFVNAFICKIISYFYELAYIIVFFSCEYLLPVKKGVWCFGTWHGHSHTMDNPRAVFEVVKNDSSIVKVVLQHQPDTFKDNSIENVLFISANSLLGAYYLAVSQVILVGIRTSGISRYSRYLTTKHLIIQLWHGIPLKKIGKLFPGENWDKETVKYSATVCSSKQDQKIMADVFSPLPHERVWVTGLPRNDFILMDEGNLPSDYKSILQGLSDRISGQKFILYAPTWRENPDDLYVFSNEELLELNNILVENNAVFGIRGHSNVRGHSSYKGGQLPERIFFVNDIKDVNIVLRLTDILITDYSSIYIDFLLKEKPILHFTYDVDSYVNERGFLYKLEDAFASQYFTTFNELIDKLASVLDGKELDKEMRLKSFDLFHEHVDNSGLQVVNKIRNLCKEL